MPYGRGRGGGGGGCSWARLRSVGDREALRLQFCRFRLRVQGSGLRVQGLGSAL